MNKGVPISPGVAVARAYCVENLLVRHKPTPIDVAALSGELARFDQACAAAGKELDLFIQRVAKEVGDDQAAIFARIGRFSAIQP